MKIEACILTGMLAAAFVAAEPAFPASLPDTGGVPVPILVTVRPPRTGGQAPTLEPGSLTVLAGNKPAPVIGLERLAGDLKDLQLFIFLDDSTRSASLGIQLPEVRTFLESLPPSAQVAIGYMRNGMVALAQPFTTDHRKAARALRLPLALPGENGSPYFALSDLVKHWPSKEPAARRAALLLTDGVDRYYGPTIEDDPYVDAAIEDTLKQSVSIYTIYLLGAGRYGRGSWTTNIAQSRLMQVAEETGGYAYFQAFTDPVTIAPFLNDLRDRLENQYRVTISASGGKGIQTVKLRAEMPGTKVSGPTRIYVP